MTNENLLSLVEKYESPLYVYDAEKIISQYNKLQSAFETVNKLKINYACKALSNLSVLRLFNSLGAGLDTVSVQEVQLGLKAGFDPADIIFTPNGVSLGEIEQAMELGVQINIDNISILEQFGQKHPEVPVCIRMNPHIMAGGNTKISVGHIDSKFGISIHQLPFYLLSHAPLSHTRQRTGTHGRIHRRKPIITTDHVSASRHSPQSVSPTQACGSDG